MSNAIELFEKLLRESTEYQYSKRLKTNIIQDWLNENLPMVIYTKLWEAVTKYRGTIYNYASKNERVMGLPDTDKVVNVICQVIVQYIKAVPLQGLANEIGSKLGYIGLDAPKTGGELLAICHGALFDLELHSMGISVLPKIYIDRETSAKVKFLQFLPPIKARPINWTNNNNGGWVFEKKSCITGGQFNQHNMSQNLDFLNTLQGIPWELDVDILSTFGLQNKTMNKDQFTRITKEYTGIPFYFGWRFDKRGRSYSSGYDINIQTDEFGKNLLNLYNKQVLTPDGFVALRRAIVTAEGHGCITREEQDDFFFNRPTDKKDAKDPITAYKLRRDYNYASTGKAMGTTIALDAKASGLQMMAILTGCKETAAAIGLIGDKPKDVYANIAVKMNAITGGCLSKADVKRPTMTHFYNSIKTPKKAFSKTELKAFYSVLREMFPGPTEFMEDINSLWNNKALQHSWVMPDGHTCFIPVTEMVDKRIEIDELDHRRFTYRTREVTCSDNYRSLSPNVNYCVTEQ